MELRTRVSRPEVPALAVIAWLLLAAPAAASAPADLARKHPVGWERIPHPPLPGPLAAGKGAVFVPPQLREVPCLEINRQVIDEPAVEVHEGLRASPGASADRVAVVGANVRANDTAGDPASTTNSETSIAVSGSNLVAGWNDGKNFSVSPGGSGYSYSCNGGLSFTDGGVLPVPGPAARHQGDPVVTVDGAGNFYYGDLYTPDGNVTSAIAVCKGNFSGCSFTFGLPVMVASTVTDLFDKDWVTADKVGGNVYCSWTRHFAAGGNQIELSRSTDGGASWSIPLAISDPSIEECQGSRIAVGPSGEVQVIYFVYDIAARKNYMRTRRSATFGTSFGPEITLPTGPSGITSNFGSGPPGYNRAGGIGFPSLAIDNTAGANSGRVYATWEETFNYYPDSLGSLGTAAEVESNNTPGTANPITIGQSITGTLSTTTDQDWFSFTGTADQNVIIYLTPGGAPAADGFLRLFCGGGTTANRAMLSYIGFGTGLIVYTLPSAGTYYFRVLANSAALGNYAVHTGYDVPDPGDEIGRDTRDAILQSSPDGVVWDARRVVNDDPPRFDNTFPEVAVDGGGQAFVDWYDHRGDPCGIGTDIYYARSTNGSASFLPSVKVNDGPPINWNLVSSNLQPNMGDYSTLVADGCEVYANFADGRQGTPDSWVADINDCATPTLISLVHALAEPDHVELGWYAGGDAAVTATVFRREAGGDWGAIGDVHADGTSQISFRDGDVRAGARYGYRLGLAGPDGMAYFGEVWVDVPTELALAVRALANPVTGDLTVSYSLPGGHPGTIELLDVAGRSVESVKVTASGQARLGNAAVRSGIYLVKLSQGGRSVLTKAVVVH